MMFVVNKAKRPIKAVVAIAISFGVLLTFIDPLIHLLVNLIDNSRVGSRLLIFTEEGDTYGNANSINSRMDLWLVSLRTWTNSIPSFIFGIGDHVRNDTISTEASGIGNHSDFFDILAKYGIIGGVILYNILKNLFVYTKGQVTRKQYLKVLVFFCLILVFGFTKKIVLPSISIMLFIFFPLCIYYINESDKTQKYMVDNHAKHILGGDIQCLR